MSWKVAEHASPKCATWLKDYFELKALEKQQIKQRYSDLFSFWKQAIKLPCGRCLLCTRRKKHSYYQRWDGWAQKCLYEQTVTTNLPLASLHILVTFCIFFTITILCSFIMEAFGFCHLFGYLFFSGGSHVHVNYLYAFLLSPYEYLRSIYS